MKAWIMFGVSILTAWVLWNSWHKPMNVGLAAISEPRGESGPTRAQWEALNRENAELKSELERVKSAAAQNRAKPNEAKQIQTQTAAADCSAVDPAPPKPPTEAELAALAERDRRLEAEGAEFIRASNEAVAAEFERQDAGAEWAGEAVTAIHEAWRKNRLNGVGLIGLECKSSLCRVEFDYTQPAQAGLFESQLLKDLGPLFSKIARQAIGQERAVFFLGRETTS